MFYFRYTTIDGVVVRVRTWAFDDFKDPPPQGQASGQAQAEPIVGQIYKNGSFTNPAASLDTLKARLMQTASVVCNQLSSQVIPDDIHQLAYQNAVAIVGPTATVPTVDPAKTTFAQMADQNGMDPQTFATLAVEIAGVSFVLSGALTALKTDATAATTVSALGTALQAFQSTVNSVVQTLLGSGLTVTIVSPSPIVVAGING